MKRVTADTITMGQLLQLYQESNDANVVRASMCATHGRPMIASYADVTRAERYAALEICAAAWNARTESVAENHDVETLDMPAEPES